MKQDIPKQNFLNGEVHDWYRLVLGYTDELVTDLIDDFGIKEGQRVLDPFCGAGTTLVECMKRGVNSVGIDANPSSCFAAKVKTTWNIQPEILIGFLGIVQESFDDQFRRIESKATDRTYDYLAKSGMLDRGWISLRPLKKALAIKHAIRELQVPTTYKNAMMLALVAEVVHRSSNVKFGPELYCGPAKKDARVLSGFSERVVQIADDLCVTKSIRAGTADIVRGDARSCSQLVRSKGEPKFAAIITSPPYPTEHDYTRNSRLELALLEMVSDLTSLRQIKYAMIRSHTKGIYKTDADSSLVATYKPIEKLANRIDERAKKKTYGFARLYSRVLREYFGGMARHLRDVRKVLRPNAHLGYVVGDQSSYLRVHVPTAKILSLIAKDLGYTVVEIRHWRFRRSSITDRNIRENILILRNTA